jgi:hypothetical protein
LLLVQHSGCCWWQRRTFGQIAIRAEEFPATPNQKHWLADSAFVGTEADEIQAPKEWDVRSSFWFVSP